MRASLCSWRIQSGLGESVFPGFPQHLKHTGLTPSSQTMERRQDVGGLNLPLVSKPRADRSGGKQPPARRLRSPATLQPALDTATWPTKAVSEPAAYDSSHLLSQICFSKSGWASESLGSFQRRILGPTPLQPGPRRSEEQLKPRPPRALGTPNAGLSPHTDASATHTLSPGILETRCECLPEDIHLFFPGSFAFPS